MHLCLSPFAKRWVFSKHFLNFTIWTSLMWKLNGVSMSIRATPSVVMLLTKFFGREFAEQGRKSDGVLGVFTERPKIAANGQPTLPGCYTWRLTVANQCGWDSFLRRIRLISSNRIWIDLFKMEARIWFQSENFHWGIESGTMTITVGTNLRLAISLNLS